jgi:hypothetical protein
VSTFTAQPTTLPKAYADAAAKLTGRCAKRRKVANNTWLERHGDDIAIRLHQTDIVTLHPDGTATLDTGGWLTVTTKSRMNDALPGGLRLSSDRGRWFLYVSGEDRVPYVDGITVDLERRTVVSGAPDPETVKREDTANAATRKAINNYLRTTTPEEIVYAFENAGGDCWLCLGILGSDPEHLHEHLAEHYVMLSLTRRAVEARGFRSTDTILSLIYGAAKRGTVDSLYTVSLRKYLRKALTTPTVATK